MRESQYHKDSFITAMSNRSHQFSILLFAACAAVSLHSGARDMATDAKIHTSAATFLGGVADITRATPVSVYAATPSKATSTADADDEIIPMPPTNVVLVENETPGEVTLTWTAPTADTNGNPLDPAALTYVITSNNSTSSWPVVEIGIEGTTHTLVAVKPGREQQLVQYAVHAQAPDGGLIGDGGRSNIVAAGAPYTMPYQESFPGSYSTHICGVSRLQGYGTWYLGDDNTFSDVKSQDGDNGFAYFASTNQYDSASLFTGKIAITGDNPVLSFYYQTLGEDDTNEIIVKVDSGDGPEAVKGVIQSGELGQWRRAMVSLKDYVGQSIQLHFTAVANFMVYTFLDNITIEEAIPTSLSIVRFSAPEKVNAGVPAVLSATLLNAGHEIADGYSLTLFRDGEPVESDTELFPVLPFEEITLPFHETLGILDLGPHSYHLELSYEPDTDPAGKITGQLSVETVATTFPTIEISGEKTAQGTPRLMWAAPELGEQNPIEIVEDFESPDYEPFSTTEVGPWQLINYTDTDTWPYDDKNWQFPGIGTCFGFILMDPAEAGLGAECAGYNGDPDPSTGTGRCLQAFAHKQIPNNAWVISPRLSGEKQTISFMARSLDPESYNPEQFLVYYSTGSTNPDHFEAVAFTEGDPEGAPRQWTRYAATLPAGAERFAIRSYSNERYVLSIDDITFKGYLNPFAGLEVKGYNIYRDGEFLSMVPAGDEDFIDSDSENGIHTYNASVLYNQGESAMSNQVSVSTSGLDSAIAAQPSVRTSAGTIIIDGACGQTVTVTTPGGQTVARISNRDSMAVTVVPGIYIVSVGPAVHKVIVR